MNTPQQLVSQTSRAIAGKKERVIEEAISRYFNLPIEDAMKIITTEMLDCVVYPRHTVYFVEEQAIVEIYETKVICNDPANIVFQFNYKFLI